MRQPLVAVSCAIGLLSAACSPTVGTSGGSDLALSGSTVARITNDGVGGITRDTPYGEKAIAAALPGFTIEGVQTAVESNTEWAMGAFSAEGFQVLQVFKGGDGKVRTVHGVTHHLTGPNGERIGMTFEEIGTRRGDCHVGKDLWRGMAICEARGAPNVTLVYSIPEFTGPFDQLAPQEDLREAGLQRIIWTPKG